MKYEAFLICFGSLHFPKLDTDETWTKLSLSSIELLECLYQKLSEKMTTARNPQQMQKRLQGSIFCCCLEEGMAMLLCSPDSPKHSIKLDGFIVMNESLRTAWHMVRWKLLFVCAGEWKQNGIIRLSVDEIDKMALSLKASPEYQKKLVSISQEMLSAEMPFSFAMTDFPLNALPLTFRKTAVSNLEISPEDTNIITFSPEILQQKLLQNTQNIGSFLPYLFLQYGTKKQYLNQRMSAIGNHEDPKQLKNDTKELLKSYPSEKIWYFVVDDGEHQFLSPFNVNTSINFINHESIPFSELHTEMNRFITEMKQFFQQSEKTMHEKSNQKLHLFHFMKKNKK